VGWFAINEHSSFMSILKDIARNVSIALVGERTIKFCLHQKPNSRSPGSKKCTRIEKHETVRRYFVLELMSVQSSPLASTSPCQLSVLEHDGLSQGAKVGVFK
jgi:hypothetical protein